MDTNCVIYGALIAALVSVAKSVPFVARRPKLSAGALAFVSAAVPYLPAAAGLFSSVAGTHGVTVTAAEVQSFVTCVAVQFGAAITTHEAGIKQAATLLGLRTSSYAAGHDAGRAQGARDGYTAGVQASTEPATADAA